MGSGTIADKKILVFDKDGKARNVIDLMCRKLGYKNIVAVENTDEFHAELKKNLDKNAGLAGLFGAKSAGPKLMFDLIIIDYDSPSGGITKSIEALKMGYSGNFNILVVADMTHIAKLPSILNVGARDFLVKPFKFSDFKDKVDDALSGKAQVVQSFNFGGASQKSKKQGVSENPFAIKKDTPKGKLTKPVPAPESKPGPAAKNVSGQVKFVDGGAANKITGRASFYRGNKAKVIDKSKGPTATLIDGKIDGHYHEKVQVIGGGENCYWAKEVDDERVRLEYLNAKGKATGMEAKIITKEEFIYSFYLCEEHGCQILTNLGKFK